MDTQVFKISSSQAIFDLCFTIGSVKNIGFEWTPRFNFSVCFQLKNNADFPCPYQIIQDKKVWMSSIDLSSYNSGSLTLAPMQEKQIFQSCIFRSSVPINFLQQQQISCIVSIYAEDKLVATSKFSFESIIGLSTYIPIFQMNLGVIIQAKIEAQLLGIRPYNNFQQDVNEDIFLFADSFFHESKKLIKKIRNFADQIHKSFDTKQNNQTSKQDQKQKQSLQQIDVLFQDYQKIRGYKQSRIFKGKSKTEHRIQVLYFLRKLKNDHLTNIQVNWQKYLRLITSMHIKKLLIQLKKQYILDLSYEVKNKIIRNRMLESLSSCFLTASQVKKCISGFEIKKIENQTIYDTLQQSTINVQLGGKHFIILVHGLGASSLAMSFIERAIRFYFPHIFILNSKSNELVDENTSIQSMGRNLAIQIQQTMLSIPNCEEYQVSFIGHSLGGLIARSALTHLQVFKYNMCSFITLSTPHLGHICHSNKIAKVGMIALNAIQKSVVIDDLLLKNSKQERLSYLYNLSSHSGLSWFKNIVFYGCKNDGYVSINSALCDQISNSFKNKLVQQMARNIRQVIKQSRVQRFQINFVKNECKTDWEQFFIGRSSHIAFSNQQSFITFFLLHNYKYFRFDVSSQQNDSD